MLRDHLQAVHGQDYMNEKIRPRMKDIAKWSLMCASDMIDHRKNSWELYGFDFVRFSLFFTRNYNCSFVTLSSISIGRWWIPI